MEYSSRNRHCLVDMEYSLDSACLEDSLVETGGDEGDEPQPTGALAALVTVRTRALPSLSPTEELQASQRAADELSEREISSFFKEGFDVGLL